MSKKIKFWCKGCKSMLLFNLCDNPGASTFDWACTKCVVEEKDRTMSNKIELEMWFGSNSHRDLSKEIEHDGSMELFPNNIGADYNQKYHVTLEPIEGERKAEFTASELRGVVRQANAIGTVNAVDIAMRKKENNQKGFRPGGVGES